MTVHRLGGGVAHISPRGDKMSYVLQIHFADSNNVAEYEGLLHGLHITTSMGIECLIFHGDSDLVV